MQAFGSLDGPAPLLTTTWLALLLQKHHYDLNEGHYAVFDVWTTIQWKGRALRSTVTSFSDRVGSFIAAMVDWIESLDDRVIIALLALSWAVQIILICLVVNDLMAVSQIPVILFESDH